MSSERLRAERILSQDGPRERLDGDALRIAAANLLLILFAQIAVPLPFTTVPGTGQPFGVMLVALIFVARRGAITAVLADTRGTEAATRS